MNIKGLNSDEKIELRKFWWNKTVDMISRKIEISKKSNTDDPFSSLYTVEIIFDNVDEISKNESSRINQETKKSSRG